MTTTLVDAIAEETRTVLAPLDVDQYHRMIADGVLPEGAPIELIDGLLVRKDRRDSEGDIMTVGTRHAMVLTRLARTLNAAIALPAGHVRTQQPITLSRRDEPEPDISVAAGDVELYENHHPNPDDLSLVVEVADSSLSLDLGRKRELSRQAGIPEYWVVNLRDDVIEVFRGPGETDWRDRLRLSRGQTVETRLCGATVTLSVDDILGAAAR